MSAAVWTKPELLSIWQQNPRRITPASVYQLARAMLEFGFTSPVVARSPGGMVIAGHKRLAAFNYLQEWELVPPNEATDLEPANSWRRRSEPGWQVPGAPAPGVLPVRFVELDVEKAKRLAIADNRLAESGQWDSVRLAEVLADMDAEAEELSAWLGEVGFSDNERKQLDELIAGLHESTDLLDSFPDEEPLEDVVEASPPKKSRGRPPAAVEVFAPRAHTELPAEFSDGEHASTSAPVKSREKRCPRCGGTGVVDF